MELLALAGAVGVALLGAIGLACFGCYQWGWAQRDADWYRLVSQRQKEAQDALVRPLPADPLDPDSGL